MDLTQLQDALGRVFNEEKARLVFWNDPEREFLSSLPDIALDDVTILKLDENPALELKIRLEREGLDQARERGRQRPGLRAGVLAG